MLAKATRYYIRGEGLPSNVVPDGDTASTDYVNNFDFYYNFEPEGRLGRNWEDYEAPEDPPRVSAIAPDTITRYMGDIYEFTRHTIEF